jgi:DNA-binding MarR family transcriptional regulator
MPNPPKRRQSGFAGVPARISMAAPDMRLSSGAMTNRLDRMEAAGLIRRLPDPNDRRGTLIEPTETGNATWDRTTGTQARREAMIASVLEPAEREELHRLLRRLMHAFPDKAHPHEGHDFDHGERDPADEPAG